MTRYKKTGGKFPPVFEGFRVLEEHCRKPETFLALFAETHEERELMILTGALAAEVKIGKA
jgi:hypothetical protein